MHNSGSLDTAWKERCQIFKESATKHTEGVLLLEYSENLRNRADCDFEMAAREAGMLVVWEGYGSRECTLFPRDDSKSIHYPVGEE